MTTLSTHKTALVLRRSGSNYLLANKTRLEPGLPTTTPKETFTLKGETLNRLGYLQEPRPQKQNRHGWPWMWCTSILNTRRYKTTPTTGSAGL